MNTRAYAAVAADKALSPWRIDRGAPRRDDVDIDIR